jgi:hypothetical protein
LDVSPTKPFDFASSRVRAKSGGTSTRHHNTTPIVIVNPVLLCRVILIDFMAV